MSNSANHNSSPAVAAVSTAEPFANAGDRHVPAPSPIRHLYVHIPFCARICPYCAFYKDLLERSQTWRFCEAVLRELASLVGTPRCSVPTIGPSTIYFGGGTPTALNMAQLELLLRGFHE